ncbi:hypothetical protein nbrc107696_44010 [Gordonia spumicola]|uniref:DUF3152 domain-containing protein n=1 Tax=Gordonia spumicola TaxID=589161 RepID=A0A7I9VF75_9ACTN|nr:hypothetical protein nbrc107696_44010 [Gordonia spumicola]
MRARWDPTVDDEDSTNETSSNPFARFVRAFGWRAYAIPVLAVLTVLLLVATVRGGGGTTADSADADPDMRNAKVSEETHAIGVPTGDIAADALPAGALPDGGKFTTKGTTEFRVVSGSGDRFGTGKQVYTYSVEVEKGIDASQFGGDKSLAKFVDTTLNNPRSWIGGGEVSFKRVDKGVPDLRISLTSTDTTHELCGNQIKLETSCFYPPDHRVVLNEARWVRGARPFDGDDVAYRQYLVNHEVGHGIGYEKHKPCPKDGDLAPIMMQQTFGTANKDIMALDPDMKADRSLVCRPNPWPYPTEGE